MKHLLLLFLLLTLPLPAAEFPDGAWNGKPWDREKLIEAAEDGDADAMAEFAYCSQMTLLGIPYDSGKIAGYSDVASRGGSALGMVVSAEVLFHGYGFLMDQKRGLELLRKAFGAGHPHAMALLSDHTLTASHPRTECGGTFLPWIEPDLPGAMELLTKAEAGGAIHALFVRYRIARYGLGVPVDEEKGFEILSRYIEKSDSAEYAALLHHIVARPVRELVRFIPAESHGKYEKRAKGAAALGNPEVLYRIAFLETVQANSNIGVPVMIRSTNMGAERGLERLARWARWGLYDSRIDAYSVAGDILTVHGLAYALCGNGYYLQDPFILMNYAASLRERAQKESAEIRVDDKASGIFRSIIAGNPDFDEAYMELVLLS